MSSPRSTSSPSCSGRIPCCSTSTSADRLPLERQDNPVTPQVMRTSVAFSGNFDVGPEFFAFNSNVREFGYRAFWDLHMAYYYRHLSLDRRVAKRVRGLRHSRRRKSVASSATTDPLDPRGPRSRARPELLRHGRILPHGRDREQPGHGQADPGLRSPQAGSSAWGRSSWPPGSTSSISETRSSPGAWPTRTSGPTTFTPSTWGSTGTGRSTSRSRSSGSTRASATPSPMPRICGTRTATRRSCGCRSTSDRRPSGLDPTALCRARCIRSPVMFQEYLHAGIMS